MLSEIQVKRLLAEIENATRRPLTQLRTSLLRSTDPNATLWELVVLYVCSRFFEDVEHEPHPGIADVLAHDVRVGFEAFVVRSVQQREAVNLRRYYSWVISEVLSSANRKHAYDANIQPSRSEGSVSIPNQQDWKKVKASAEWPRFVEDVREHAKAVFVDSLSNLVIALQLRNSGGGSVNSYLPQVPEVIEDHPVYRAIRKKARCSGLQTSARQPANTADSGPD
jgi:hypothetical protein